MLEHFRWDLPAVGYVTGAGAVVGGLKGELCANGSPGGIFPCGALVFLWLFFGVTGVHH